MAQDESTVQDTPMQVEFSPQTNPEPEGSAGAAAAFDTPPPPLRQIPSPVPSETTTDHGGSVLLEPSGTEQLMRMMQAMGKEINEMKENACDLKKLYGCEHTKHDGLYGCAHEGNEG